MVLQSGIKAWYSVRERRERSEELVRTRFKKRSAIGNKAERILHGIRYNLFLLLVCGLKEV